MVFAQRHDPTGRRCGGPVCAVATRLAVRDERAKLKAIEVFNKVMSFRQHRLNRGCRVNNDVIDGPPPVVVTLMIPRDDHRLGTGRVGDVQGDRVVVRGRRVRGQLEQHDRFATVEGGEYLALLRFLAPARVITQNECVFLHSQQADRRGGEGGIELGVGLVIVLIRIGHGDSATALGELSTILSRRGVPRNRVKEGPTVELDDIIATRCRAVIFAQSHDPTGRRGGGPVGAVATGFAVRHKRAKLKAVKVLREERLQLAGDLDVVDGPPPVVVTLMIPGDDHARGPLGVVHANGHRVIVSGGCIGAEHQ